MNSLLSYGSDDDLDDSSDERSTPVGSLKNLRKQDDTNYDEVQMSLSEDSNDESKSSSTDRGGRHSPKPKEDRHRKDRAGDRDRNSGREKEEDRNGRGSKEEDSRDRGRSRLSDSRGRDRDNRDKYRDSDRGRWDEKRGRSRDRSRDRERYSARDSKHSRDKPLDRDRRDRDRRRSKSPRDSDRPRSRSRSPRRDRSRSNSREKMPRKFPYKRFERGANREKFERMGFEPKKTDNFDPLNPPSEDQKDRFFVPGITGRFRDQIEKRKLLWQKKEDDAPKQGPSKAATTFAQDTDGKVANKFKRLMGIKNVGEGSKPATEVLKKQEEMFSSMEQQYEVARTTTHTMRGVGLGFGSYQR